MKSIDNLLKHVNKSFLLNVSRFVHNNSPAILQCLNEHKGTTTALNQHNVYQHTLYAVAFNVGRLNTVWFILACSTCVVNSVVSVYYLFFLRG